MKSFDRPIGYGLRLVVAGLLVFCGSAAVFGPALLAQSVDQLPKPTDYVSDYAHVLSAGAISEIDQIAGQLDHSAAKAQLAVVTVKSINGEDRDQYANDLFHKWGIGGKGSDRGVLIFLSVDDHQRRIEVGFGLEGILPDGKVGDIGRSAVPYLRQQNYDEAVLTQVNQVAQVIAADAKVTLNEDEPAQPQVTAPRRVHHGNPFGGIILLIILLVLFGGSWIFRLLFGGLLLNSLTGGWRGGGWGSGGGWGGGGGGGWGGGDSGGGGGFGGFGGGDSGGGGAGGSW